MSRSWFITGVSSGLGRSLAEAALEAGDRVAGSVRSEDAVAPFEALQPERTLALIADVTDAAALTCAIRTADAALGGLDVLVNNAGYGLIGAVEEVSLAEARAQFETNVFGAMAAIQAVLPLMRARQSGHIVNITSVSGLAAWAGTGVYCASKFALEGLGQALAQELAPLGIKVTNVAPGGLRTAYAGRSLRRAAQVIEDYDGPGHFAGETLSEHAGQERGDPRRAAAAILKLVESAAAPMHLLLGADAVHYATRAMGTFQIEMGEWADLTMSTAFPED